MEPRTLLSGTVPVAPGTPIVTDPIVVSGSGMATPFGSTSPYEYSPITPALMRDAYGLGTYGSSNVTFNGVQGTGAGQTIALIEAASDPDIATDLADFDSYWGLPAPPSFKQLNGTGGTSLPAANGGVATELDLDVEWAHVMAPLANLVIYESSTNLYQAITTAENAPGVSVISVSYGIGGVEAMSEFETPSGHAGVTVTASTGDTGGEVTDPSMSPAVVAVGGTTLTMSGTSYGSESAWSDGGGGINTSEAQPSYQNGVVSAYSTTNRTVPDVALDADDNSSGVAVYDIYNNGTAAPWDVGVGGTSLSSPLMAGIIAVADQGRAAAGLTSLDGYTQTLPRLYKLPAADFHDITTGNNTHPATVGYDLASGIGSPVANKLIPDLAGADTITGTVFTDLTGSGVYGGSDTPLANQTVYLDLNKSGVQTSSDPTAITNANGVYTFTDQAGGETGIVRLASVPAGDLHSTSPTSFTTSYDQTQTINIGVYPVTNTVVATPSTVTGTTTALSLSGTPPTSSAFLYTWSTASEPSGATVSFSANGTNAAENTTATFTKIGSYTFTLKITDGQGGTVSLTSSTVTVAQGVSSITVTPAAVNVTDGGTSQLAATAYDQFGNVLATQPTFTWSILAAGLGSVSSTGLFTAPASGGDVTTVQASVGSVAGTAAVTVISNYIAGTSGNDVIRLVRSGANELVYINNPNVPAYNLSYGSLGALTIASGAGTDTVDIDFSGGATPVPAGGLNVSSGATTGNDTLIITGTSIDDIAKVSGTSVTFNGSVINYANINSIVINGNGGDDLFTQTAQPGNGASLVFNSGTSGGPSANDSINIKAGNFSFAAPAAGSGVQPIEISSLSISSGASVSVATGASHSDRWILVLGALQNSGNLDLGGNDMIVQGGSLSTISQEVASASNGDLWNGTGITSSAAENDPTQLTALGVATAAAAGNLTFDGQSVSSADVLVKYTYIGDTNLDGQVDGSDYSNIDNGFISGLTGWSNGDLNYDGVVDGSDYALIDNAFNTQGASLAATVASQIATTAPGAATSGQRSARSSATPTTTVFAASAPIVLPPPDNANSLFWKWYDKADVFTL